MADHTQSRRVRRPQEHVRTLLLESARERFAAHGYAGVSVRRIAADAGASPQLVFNYFGSKSGLFEAAVLAPFEAYVAEIGLNLLTRSDNLSMLEDTRAFVTGLYDLFDRYRSLVLALITAQGTTGEGAGEKATASFGRLLEPMDKFAHSDEGRRRLWEGYDGRIAVRALMGLVISMTVLDTLLLDADSKPSRDEMIEQLSHLMAHGYAPPA
jgi:AcrR family transcriptional regulator